MESTTIFAAIGNSDDKLTQSQWSELAKAFMDIIREHASKIYGEWVSISTAPFQNACVGFEITDNSGPILRSALTQLRASYSQDSVAWSVVYQTDFI